MCLHIATPSNTYELLLHYIASFLLRQITATLLQCDFIFHLGTCPLLEIPRSTMISYEPPPPLREGTIAMISCPPEFPLRGAVNRTCQNGTWPGSTTCECSATNHAVALGVWLRMCTRSYYTLSREKDVPHK